MKKIILIKMTVLFFLCTNVYCQNKDIEYVDIDSLFLSHFLSLDKNIECDSHEVFVPQNDRDFIYVVSYLSGIPFTLHSYSGHPILNRKKLLEYKEWYFQYKQKIKCKSYFKVLNLLEEITKINASITEEQDFNEKMDEVMKELEKCKIE